MTDENPQSPPTNQPNQAPADTTPPSDTTTGDRIEPAGTTVDPRSDEQKRAEATSNIGPQTGTMPGSFAGPAAGGTPGPGDETAREGQVIEPDDATKAQRRAVDEAERADAGRPAVQDRTE